MRRSSHEVAAQAIISGALAFRASLEVTVHPRCTSLCAQLLPWLESQNCGDQVNDFHRQILQTPHQELPPDSQREAYLRRESASLLGWSVQLLDEPSPTVPIEVDELLTKLHILLPDARDHVSGARLRPTPEVDDYCAFCMTVRHRFHLAALEESGQATLKRIHQSRLAEFGLSDVSSRKEIEIEAAHLASAAPGVQWIYTVRALAAEWLLGEDL